MEDKCKEYNLRFGSGTIGAATIPVLGFEVGADEMKPLEKALKAIENFEKPKNKKEVRRFLGKCGYYRSLVQDYAMMAAPLEELTKRDVQFIWSVEHDEAFEKMKKALCREMQESGIIARASLWRSLWMHLMKAWEEVWCRMARSFGG